MNKAFFQKEAYRDIRDSLLVGCSERYVMLFILDEGPILRIGCHSIKIYDH